MARETRNLNVSYSPAARHALAGIWTWNAQQYGVHADRYVAFLRAETDKLANSYYRGKAVPGTRRLNYDQIRRRQRGHGHVAVYELVQNTIYVLNYYHTAQDW